MFHNILQPIFLTKKNNKINNKINNMLLLDILDIVEKIAPLKGAALWDKSGLQVASSKKIIKNISICLDPIPASIHTAIKNGSELIISHHPLLLKPRLPDKLDSYHEVLKAVLKNDIALYAAHTSLDTNPQGPVNWLAKLLELKNIDIIEPISAFSQEKLGFGIVGELDRACTIDILLEKIAARCDLSTATICGPKVNTVKKIAYCTGSGASLIEAVEKTGADIYISGDIKYHTALDTKICILDLGHHCLEEEMMFCFSEILKRQLIGINITFVPSASPIQVLKTRAL